ncbi:protein kinase domain-containing protein, partial [Haematococcus lacustris]
GGLQQALRPRSVALTMAPKKADPLLRPFEMCSAYAQHEEYVEKWLV